MTSNQIDLIHDFYQKDFEKNSDFLISNFEQTAIEIDQRWLDIIKEFDRKNIQIRLVIFGEAPLSFEKYFYNKPGLFLYGLTQHYNITNDQLISYMIQRGLLLFDLYKYALTSEFYKKHHKHFIDNNYIEKKLKLIEAKFDQNTKFIFRYKMLVNRKLYEIGAFKEYQDRFLTIDQKPTTLFEKERPKQVLRDLLKNYV